MCREGMWLHACWKERGGGGEITTKDMQSNLLQSGVE